MSRSRRKVFSVVVLAGLALGLLTACSKQGEGERCDSNVAGNSDCEDGLYCARIGTVERCCPPEGARISDDRCDAASIPTAGTGGGSSTPGSSGSAGANGGVSGGGTTGNGGAETGGTNSAGSETGGTSSAAAGNGGMSGGDAGETSAAGTSS